MPLWHVRKGFLLTALIGTSFIGSTLWAIALLPYLPGHPMEPMVSSPQMIVARVQSPPELAWFFIQFPYISPQVQVRAKNHHTFIVMDSRRQREYVITIAQRFRRVEIYYGNDRKRCDIQLFMPGYKRIVTIRGVAVTNDLKQKDNNAWMWKSPLWNAEQIKIYAMADFWRDAPYKRFSCAGFVHQFLHEAGVHVPVLDAWDYAKQPWARIPFDEMEPGDIIAIKAASESHRHFWHHTVTHVGVYLGGGKMIHAATSSISSRRAWVRIVDVREFRSRIDKILRPPQML